MLTAIGSPLAVAVASAEAVRTDLKLAVSRTAAGLIKSWRGQGERSQILRFVQPSLIGLIDGTISTLAPIFAAAFLVGSHGALLVGLAASLGAAISMGLSEALSDDGELSGRGNSLVRGTLTGMATFVGGPGPASPLADPGHHGRLRGGRPRRPHRPCLAGGKNSLLRPHSLSWPAGWTVMTGLALAGGSGACGR